MSDDCNYVHFSGVRFICSPYLAIKPALASLGPMMTRFRPQLNIAPSKLTLLSYLNRGSLKLPKSTRNRAHSSRVRYRKKFVVSSYLVLSLLKLLMRNQLQKRHCKGSQQSFLLPLARREAVTILSNKLDSNV